MVNSTNINKTENSRLLKSGILYLKSFEKGPAKAIILNMYMVYAALNIIEELANTPNKGNLSKVPYRLINSPIKFSERGVPAFPKQRIKNNIEKTGIICAIPL